jgi:CubicO group peptidase (beta-lactamase class C family)
MKRATAYLIAPALVVYLCLYVLHSQTDAQPAAKVSEQPELSSQPIVLPEPGSSPDPGIHSCDANGCIDLSTFQANIVAKLAGKVEGYVVMVGPLSPVYGGNARTACDPPVTPMSPDLPMNIESVSKTLTTIAILQLLTNAGLTIDTKIAPYIYNWWKPLGQNVDQIRFRDLLTHTSGFGQLSICPNAVTYAGVKEVVESTVDQSNIGNSKNAAYGNCNFAVLRELMPSLLGLTSNTCNTPSPSILSQCNSDSANAQLSSNIYIDYMNQHVFAPLSIPTSACKPTEPNEILSYPFPPGSPMGWSGTTIR